MKAAFIVNARNKVKYVARAVRSALEQTYPCHILLSDQGSEDGTFEAMEQAVDEAGVPDRHQVEVIRCPIKGAYGMAAANAHTLWLFAQTDAEWVFQCSADDWSMPERVSVCMAKLAELKRKSQTCSAVSCANYYLHAEDEFDPKTTPHMQMPEDMYVSPGFGLTNLVYGSTIQGWHREWFLKVGSAGEVTGDVFHGFLAACDKGYYVIAKPMHVKVEYADFDNMGFQGKMKAAEKSGDKQTMARINELNRFQLFGLYYRIKARQQELYPLAHAQDQNALVNMMLQQAVGWYNERDGLHKNGITPATL